MNRTFRYRFLVLLLFGVVVISGCSDSSIRKVIAPTKFPVAIDTFGWEPMVYGFNNDFNWFSDADYHVYYIGQFQDTVYLRSIVGSEKYQPYEGYNVPYGSTPNYKHLSKVKLKIRVDISKRVSNAYVVMLENENSDTIEIGISDEIPMVLEAKKKNGKWQRIQDETIIGCPVGARVVLLPPKEIALSLVPIFKGTYKTKLRLTVGSNYSNEFDGFINPNQFHRESN